MNPKQFAMNGVVGSNMGGSRNQNPLGQVGVANNN